MVILTTALPFYGKASDSSDSVAEDSEATINETYKLGANDKLRITVFGEEDLSGEFEVDGTGIISLPLIGNVKVNNVGLRDLEKTLVKKFEDGYLKNPRVSIEVMNFRPFFILGEVKNPGSYPYVNGMNVLNAVAVAGGFTHRARRDRVVIKRGQGD
ncbi:polysaccharide export protein, partial [Rickettsiales bacterium]|nr:polysaccharide export protein [Rickettsiales bacterium]